MSTGDKFENSADKLGGQAKEGLGKLTGDKETEYEGKTQQAGADVKGALEDVKDALKGVAEGLRGKNDGKG